MKVKFKQGLAYASLTTGLILAGCGHDKDKNDQTAPPNNDVIPGISLTTGIDASQRQSLIADLNILKTRPVSKSTQHQSAFLLTEYMGITDLESQSLIDWLNTRITYVFGETSNPEVQVIDVGRSEIWSLPSDFLEELGIDTNTAAVNLGTALYGFSQEISSTVKRPVYARLNQPNVAPINITSPRTGIMMIGPALFDPDFSPSYRETDTEANSYFRLSTIFHEARHSDGNAAANSMGFAHVLCPTDRDFPSQLEGKYACDHAANGAYGIGSFLLQILADQCQSCTNSERTRLQILYLDSRTRIIGNNDEPQILDPTPEAPMAIAKEDELVYQGVIK